MLNFDSAARSAAPCDARRGDGKKKKGCGENEFLPPPSPPCPHFFAPAVWGLRRLAAAKNNLIIVKPLAPKPTRARGFKHFVLP